jgi:adenylate kinase
MNNKQDELVKNYQELKKKPNSEQALNILKRLASQVKPILINRHWTIQNLCEFFPSNPNLLGKRCSQFEKKER